MHTGYGEDAATLAIKKMKLVRGIDVICNPWQSQCKRIHWTGCINDERNESVCSAVTCEVIEFYRCRTVHTTFVGSFINGKSTYGRHSFVWIFHAPLMQIYNTLISTDDWCDTRNIIIHRMTELPFEHDQIVLSPKCLNQAQVFLVVVFPFYTLQVTRALKIMKLSNEN